MEESRVRYVGIINTVTARGFAFIDKKSIERIDGAPMDVILREDVFLHVKDTPALESRRLVRGKTVTFTIGAQKYGRREGRYNAYNVLT
jgi:cold shock CspA family protein